MEVAKVAQGKPVARRGRKAGGLVTEGETARSPISPFAIANTEVPCR
jgi:hypothetical protein